MRSAGPGELSVGEDREVAGGGSNDAIDQSEVAFIEARPVSFMPCNC